MLPGTLFAVDYRIIKLSVRAGDLVEYIYEGKNFRAVVQAVLWVSGMKARILPTIKGHPTTWPINKLTVIKESE